MGRKANAGRVSPAETEISLPDLIGFFKKNVGFLLLTALLFSAVAVAVALLLPREYEKQVTLTVTPVTSPLLGRFEQEDGGGGLLLDEPRPDDAGEQAADYLQEASPRGVETSAKYDDNSQQIQVVLSSERRGALREAGPEVADLAGEASREENELSLEAALEGERLRLEREAEVYEQVVADLEEEIGSLEASGGSAARIAALEQSRVELLTQIAQAKIRLGDLEQAREDLPRLAAELVAVEVVNESPISRATPLAVALVAAIAAALLAAVAATFVRAALRKG
ncbi:MAG: hypothetical protein M3P49_01620 [Actinomycetota bacterium]|nr:hypothetical protein [Actinomycetota bacterium]